MITSAKWQQLKEYMVKLGIHEADVQEKFILGSGRGGQKLQKTSSCVYLHHIPSGIEIKCQESRSREDNRFYARRRLCEKIAAQILGEQSEQQQKIEKIRRQKRRRTRKAKEKILQEKAHRSEIKKSRQTVTKKDTE